jgi:hypothetical protein
MMYRANGMRYNCLAMFSEKFNMMKSSVNIITFC